MNFRDRDIYQVKYVYKRFSQRKAFLADKQVILYDDITTARIVI